jgi:hypothetical protein
MELGQLLHRSECLIAGSFQSFDVLLFTADFGQFRTFASLINRILLWKHIRATIWNVRSLAWFVDFMFIQALV